MSDDADVRDEAVDSGLGLSRSNGEMDASPQNQQSQPQSTPDQSSSVTQRTSRTTSTVPFEWSDRGSDLLSKPPIDPVAHTPSGTDGELRYVNERYGSVTGNLEQLGTRVRPELYKEVNMFIKNVETQFDSRVYDADVYEAMFTVALWHAPEVIALMAELGHVPTDD